MTKPATEERVAHTPQTVLVLRTCKADGTSHDGFKWPDSGEVVAPDWKPTAECGNGLHGWLWGSGNWSLKAQGENIKWLVLEVDPLLRREERAVSRSDGVCRRGRNQGGYVVRSEKRQAK